jgi:hypothetical protein
MHTVQVERGANRVISLSAVALGLVVVAGGLCLPMPFWGDQALFTVYARALIRGAVLYRDIFDVKQPGIFLFYAAGGSIFGFSEIGIHLFELIYWLVFSLFMLIALRPYFAHRWAASLLPLATVVVYYLHAGTLDLTQLEMLVAFPIVVGWWLIDRAQPETHTGRRRYAAAGLAAAAVVLLKHLYILIVLALLGYVVLRSWRRDVAVADIRRCLVAFVVALAVPLGIVVAYFAFHGQLQRIWWIYFEFAPATQVLAPRPFEHLVFGARRFLIGHAPVLVLAVLGCVHVLRWRVQPQMDLALGMVLWGVSGAIAFFVLQGWPEYKWSLFTVPLGILAVMGVEVLGTATILGRRRPLALLVWTSLAILSFMVGAPVPQVQTRLLVSVVIGICSAMAAALFGLRPSARACLLHVVSAALAVTVGLAAIAPANKLRWLWQYNFALTIDSRTAFQWSWNYAYKAADEDLAILQSGDVLPGPFYVFGDPVLLVRANRSQAVSIPGWGPDFLDNRAWRELHSELRSALPPYIIVNKFSESAIRSRYPTIMDMIESRYRVAFVGASGTWYVLR